ncbi:adenosylcobinamide-GDP ribazoletransferase [Chitinibacteraceae bacterium HSL-7]
MWRDELILAFQFLTRWPTPQVRHFSDDKLARSARWFVLVGLALGGVLAAALFGASRLDPWLGAWLVLLLWVWSTGGLHLDGLADLADALGAAHRSPERFLAVMKDPHLGSFGVLTLIMAVSGKLVLLMLLARSGQYWPLLLIPAWARLGTLYWQTLPPISAEQQERFVWAPRPITRWLWLLALAALSAWLAPWLLAAPVVIALYRAWLLRRVGGVSGDCLGAGIEVSELALLAVLACAV